jgi:hypothetical protein
MAVLQRLVFERLNLCERIGPDSDPEPMKEELFRAQIPGGWLILTRGVRPALIFYPDPQHRWDGGSMER